MGWSGTGTGDVVVACADLDRFCQGRLEGGGPCDQRLISWLRAHHVDPTYEGAGNLVRLEFTTFNGAYPYKSPDVVLDALTDVARLGSRIDVIDEDGDVTRRVLVDDDGGRHWVVAVT